VGKVRFEARIKELVENLPDLALLVEPLLVVRRVLREQLGILHRRLLAIVRDDEVCRRLMMTPGVGPVVALTYRATVDVPARFRKSKSVGAVFVLTCAKYQSGESERSGRISRCGDEMMRVMLYEAAQAMLHSKRWSWLKAWAIKMIQQLTSLRGIGVQSATVLVREAFVRRFANGKALGSYTGLASSPYSSGGIDREQGIGKAGNRRVRTVMVELAWLWTRYQPGAAQVRWFRERVGSTGRRARKIMVVALARKLLIALWRFVIDGVVPEGAILKPAA
jgi:transposase